MNKAFSCQEAVRQHAPPGEPGLCRERSRQRARRLGAALGRTQASWAGQPSLQLSRLVPRRGGGAGEGSGLAARGQGCWRQGLPRASPPLIAPGRGHGRPHGSRPTALALRSGKTDATRPPLRAVLPERKPDGQDKERTDPCGSQLRADSKGGAWRHPAAPQEPPRASASSCRNVGTAIIGCVSE